MSHKLLLGKNPGKVSWTLKFLRKLIYKAALGLEQGKSTKKLGSGKNWGLVIGTKMKKEIPSARKQ